jgi:thioesterase domain-containing protein
MAALPKPEVSFNYLGQLDQVLEGSSLLAAAPESRGESQDPARPRRYLLDVTGSVFGGRMQFALGYGRNVHRPETIARVAEALLARLRAIIAGAEGAVRDRPVEHRRASEASAPALVALRAEGTRTPLFVVHGIGGSAQAFHKLALHLADTPVYGLEAAGLTEGSACADLPAMAARYLAEIRAVQPRGPYQLGGWSMGGVVAFEIARQLRAAGERASALLLLDATATPERGDEDDPEDLGALLHFAGHAGAAVDRDQLLALDATDRFALVARHLGVDAAYVERMGALYEAHRRALADYAPRGHYDGPVTLFRAGGGEPRTTSDATLGWASRVTGAVSVEAVSGSHLTLLQEPHVAALAAAVRRRLS